MKTLSKRKMESYMRAEIVAQRVRAYIANGFNNTQDQADELAQSVIDWMEVTGKKVKYAESPRRCGKKY